jgi:hypothetical protein
MVSIKFLRPWWGGTLACGLGVGESQFRRLEKKLCLQPGIRQKNLIEIGEYAKTISAHIEDWTGGMHTAQLFTLHKGQYSPNTPKSILAHMEMTSKENTRQKFFLCSLYMTIESN